MIKIEIPGVPIAQARMRYFMRRGITRIYDPNDKEKKEIKRIIQTQHGDNNHFINPRISFVFHMPILKSTSKKQLELYNSGKLKHQKKPDVDNFIKLYLDCLDGICFEGDQRVSLGNCVKLYHPNPKTIVIIEEMNEIIQPAEVDLSVWDYLFGVESDKQSSAGTGALHDSYSPHRLTIPRFADKRALEHASLASSVNFVAPRVVEPEFRAS